MAAKQKYCSMIRLFVQDRNTSNTAVQYTRNTKKLDKRNVREVPKQTLIVNICHLD